MVDFPGSRFVGGAWPNGFGLRFTPAADGRVAAAFVFDELKQGPAGIVHGGAIAAVLDEAMTAAVFAAGRPAFTVQLSVRYRKAVPIGVETTIEAWLEQTRGRKLFLRGCVLLVDHTCAAEADGVFISDPRAAGGQHQ